MAKKITELPSAASFEGLVALGVDTASNVSVQIPLQFVKDGADAANVAAALAGTEAAAATAATQSAATAAANTNAAIATANEVAANPTKVGEDNYVYVYDLKTGVYIKTDIYVRGTDGYGAVLQDSGDSTTGVMSQKATTDALARRIEIDKEGELPAAADVAAIAHLRAVGAEGDSVIATPAQLREMVGIDYSSLEEQEVPGEFFIGSDGVPKQVYRRTISAQGIFAPWGDNQAMFSSHTPLSNVDCVISVSGYTVIADAEGSSKPLLTKYTELVLFTYNAGGGFYEANRVKIVCIVDGRSVGQTVKICATIKYIKL